MKKWIHTIFSENRFFFLNWEGILGGGLKNNFGRHFPIFIEIGCIVSYATNERAMAWFH